MNNYYCSQKFNRGYPVALLISSSTSQLTLKRFLDETKRRYSDSFKVNCVITDDDNTWWNTFTAIFGDSKHLLCKWHITCAWR